MMSREAEPSRRNRPRPPVEVHKGTQEREEVWTNLRLVDTDETARVFPEKQLRVVELAQI